MPRSYGVFLSRPSGAGSRVSGAALACRAERRDVRHHQPQDRTRAEKPFSLLSSPPPPPSPAFLILNAPSCFFLSFGLKNFPRAQGHTLDLRSRQTQERGEGGHMDRWGPSIQHLMLLLLYSFYLDPFIMPKQLIGLKVNTQH